MANTKPPAALGFRAHTGWAALVAAAGPASSPAILHRSRVEMIPSGDLDPPRFVYHAAAKVPLRSAERLVRAAEAQALQSATEAVAAAVGELRERGHRVVASGVIMGNQPLTATLETILAAHHLMHAAEGELFRQALIGASQACQLPITCVPARELYPLGAEELGVAEDLVRERLDEAGRGAGRPWAQDQKESLLVALLALRDRRDPSRSPRPRRSSRRS